MLDDRWQSLAATDVSRSPNDAGLVRLDDLCALSFTGNDVATFLQGYLTCDTTSLVPDKLQPAALCNLKGRVMAYGWALTLAQLTDQILWLVPAELCAGLLHFLKPYLRFSKTHAEPLQEDHLVIGSAGPAGNNAIAEGIHLQLVRSTAELEQQWQAHGPGIREAFDVRLIRARIPWLSTPTTAQFLPQMLDLVGLGAISFDKGCYLGQEVVARAQHRGAVKRTLRLLTHVTASTANPGAAILDEQGRTVGTIVSSAAYGGEAVSLGVVQNEVSGPLQESGSGLILNS